MEFFWEISEVGNLNLDLTPIVWSDHFRFHCALLGYVIPRGNASQVFFYTSGLTTVATRTNPVSIRSELG